MSAGKVVLRRPASSPAFASTKAPSQRENTTRAFAPRARTGTKAARASRAGEGRRVSQQADRVLAQHAVEASRLQAARLRGGRDLDRVGAGLEQEALLLRRLRLAPGEVDRDVESGLAAA